jgi:hypothetical protein
VSNEVNRVVLKFVVSENLPHGVLLQIKAREGLGIRLIEVLDEDKEVLARALLKEAHQVRAQSFLVRRRNLLDFVSLQDVGTLDALEFQILGDSSMKKDLDQNTSRHDEFGNQVDVPVARGTKGFRGSGGRAVLFEQLGQIQ